MSGQSRVIDPALSYHIICFLPAFFLHVIGPYDFLATPHGFDLALKKVLKILLSTNRFG